jgi:hypothetical protein
LCEEEDCDPDTGVCEIVPVEYNPSSISGNGTSLQNLALSANDGALYKAAWNYGLNFEDETINGCVSLDDTECDPPHTRRGVHNHAFSQQGLLGAINAVQNVAAP